MKDRVQRDPVNVFDVAAYILKKHGPMTTMKLQKLVYYSQAWSLVWDERPLFPEKILAWANGPVVRELFKYFQGSYQVSGAPAGNPSKLDKDQVDTIDAVLAHYGKKPSQWLSDLTHLEPPWKEARQGLSDDQRGDTEITLASMNEYYGSI